MEAFQQGVIIQPDDVDVPILVGNNVKLSSSNNNNNNNKNNQSRKSTSKIGHIHTNFYRKSNLILEKIVD